MSEDKKEDPGKEVLDGVFSHIKREKMNPEDMDLNKIREITESYFAGFSHAYLLLVREVPKMDTEVARNRLGDINQELLEHFRYREKKNKYHKK